MSLRPPKEFVAGGITAEVVVVVCCVRGVLCVAIRRILTPLQTAHVHVLAYPYECSALSLLDAIATGDQLHQLLHLCIGQLIRLSPRMHLCKRHSCHSRKLQQSCSL